MNNATEKKEYRSVLHTGPMNCGGELVIAAEKNGDAVIACKRCMDVWEIDVWGTDMFKFKIDDDMEVWNGDAKDE